MRMRRLNNLTQSKHDREADDEELTKEESEEGYEKGPRSASTRSSDDDETRPCSVEDSLTLSQMYRYRGTTPSAPTPSTPFPAFEGRSNKSKVKKGKLDKKKKPSDSKLPNQEVATSNGPKPQNSPGHAKSPAMIRAEEIQSSLGSQFPSFTRLMGLPKLFSKSYLPRTNTTLVLEDETGEQFDLKYIAEKTGLSGGWRRFAVGHNLLEGDALVFHMVRPNKFKVHIVRAKDLAEVDGPCGILDAHTVQTDAERTTTTSKTKKRKPLKSLPLAVCQKKKRTGLSRSVPQLAQQVEQSGNDSEGISSKVVADSDFSGPAFLFEDVKRFEDFHIQINGLCIDSELPEHLRMKYYELCRYRNEFLHVGLIPGLYSKLAAGIIGETVNIADAIRACKLTTFLSEFAVWEKSLKSFELLGMNVEFLHNRMGRLLSISIDARGVSDAQREAKSEQTRIVNEIKNLEAKVLELKGASEKFDALQSKVEEYELKFQEEANAPW